jgi:uncharacterized protein (DUF2252 family)
MKKAARSDVVTRIARHNRGREPERLAMKYAKMAQSPFVFLRGACHLFYDTLPDVHALRAAPLAWCCGDLHFENLGSYKGDNRLAYFDINDFDEAALAPATWDIVRLLTSIQCGEETLRATRSQARAVSRVCLRAYRDALIDGKPRWVERDTSVGLVKTLLASLDRRRRSAFLDGRTTLKRGKRSLKLDADKALPATKAQKAKVAKTMHRFAATQAHPAFFKVLDVGRRVAGTGSLGLERFVVLVRGDGSPHGNYLLEIKQAMPSALRPHLARLRVKQPAWKSDAKRVAAVQDYMQAIDHAFLHPVRYGSLSCILKELQPSADRVAIGAWGKKVERLEEVVATMGRVLAWDQLRASGRSGAASADQLVAFAKGEDWEKQVLKAADEMAATTRKQWKVFAASRVTPA